MATKIDFNLWARLIQGNVRISEGGRTNPTLVKQGDMFLMTRWNHQTESYEQHSLLIDVTDDIRLNEHWQQFANGV